VVRSHGARVMAALPVSDIVTQSGHNRNAFPRKEIGNQHRYKQSN
jgi:hypothetical protein